MRDGPDARDELFCVPRVLAVFVLEDPRERRFQGAGLHKRGPFSESRSRLTLFLHL